MWPSFFVLISARPQFLARSQPLALYGVVFHRLTPVRTSTPYQPKRNFAAFFSF
jgi:hypothetical protein